MDTNAQITLVIILVVITLILVCILYKNMKATSLKKELDEINVRFNRVKTIPLAFKLNKAQAMAKLNEETSKKVEEYYSKFEEAQKNLDRLQDLIEGIEDDVASKNQSDAKKSILVVKENLKDSEEEVAAIDQFLEQFSKQESTQREYSNQLKERFREVKLKVHEESNHLSIAYEGMEEQLQLCEELFSSFEEWMYANEFVNAQEDLDKIEMTIDEMEKSVELVPSLIQDAKGVLPVLMDEVDRQYALSKQREVYLDHLKIEDAIHAIAKGLNENVKILAEGKITGVAENLEKAKAELNEILKKLEQENVAYQASKKESDAVLKNINEVERLYHYVYSVCENESERYRLEGLKESLEEEKTKIQNYKDQYMALNQLISSNQTPATVVLEKAEAIMKNLLEDRNLLSSYKAMIDKTSSDESRAIAQVMKLQVVLNEVQVKIAQYRLPAISSSYKEDLKKGHDYVREIKDLLKEIPLNIETLNRVLDEAIDYIYKLYNNVNNVVGMALMVENAIVFGNKYRSTYPEVDRELSRAEFAYLNGEYTQALTIAIACMESLFPNSADEKILENAKSVA